jgi:hypothetical protein
VQNPDALSDIGCPGQCTGQRPTLNTYLALEYAANDICHCWGGAAETLEDSLADFSLAMWARRAGRKDLYRQLLPRGDYWKNTFNPAVGYQAARKADGSWQAGFTPSTDVGFAQGSSATYTWMVPQDVSGLAALMGGRDAAAARLDGFFHDENGNWAVLGGNALRYDPTNEPGIHAPWLYDGLGRPWQTQETVRQIVDTAYGTGPAGLPGNDDLGTMSAWYVFAAMGFFPQPGLHPGGAAARQRGAAHGQGERHRDVRAGGQGRRRTDLAVVAAGVVRAARRHRRLHPRRHPGPHLGDGRRRPAARPLTSVAPARAGRGHAQVTPWGSGSRRPRRTRSATGCPPRR